MARILALDTTAELGSIALYDSERDVVEEVAIHSPEGFGHVLFQRIEELLARCGSAIHAIDCFASAAGPGSFTGVRVGLTAAKGLAEATSRKVAPVSNLRALAWFATGDFRATILDARRGEIYGAVYSRNLEAIVPERVMKFTDWLQALPAEPLEFISSNFAPFAAGLSASRFRDARVVDAPRLLAGAIARIASEDFKAGRGLDPAAVDANYVRRSDAELFWKEN